MLNNLKIMGVMLKSVGFAIALLIPIALGNSGITWTHICSVFSISLLSVLVGCQIAYKLGINKLVGFTAAFEIVIGFSVLSLLELILILIFKLSAIQAFSVAALLIGILSLVNIKLFLPGKEDQLKGNLKFVALDIGVLIFISLLTTLWCRELIMSVPEAKITGVFHAWPDIFLHATQIVSLQSYSVLTNQSFYLAGVEQPLYHVASYAISAFYASINNEPVLNVTTYFWVPVGIILMGIGVYGLGCALAGRMAGFFATAAIFLLPDASMYGLKIGYFGFHWLMQISPGSGYAMALVLIALAMYVRGMQEGKFGLVLWSLPIVLSSAIFRVQIAAPAAIMFVILTMIAWQPAKKWHRRVGLMIFITTLISTIILFESIELAPHFLSGNYTASIFFDAIHDKVTTSSYGAGIVGGMYKYLISHSPMLLNWIIGYVVFLVAALGLIFPIMLIWSIKKLRSRKEWQINSIPAVLFLSCFMIIVFLPVPADGDFSNFGHRQFVLLYAVYLTILVSWITLGCKQLFLKYHLSNGVGFAIVFSFLLLGVSVPWAKGQGIQQPHDWAHNITITPISANLFKVTKYIREQSSIDDVVLNSDPDHFAAVVSLTERRAFMSRDVFYNNYKEESGKIFRRRALELERLKSIKSFVALCTFAAKYNIKWFLKYPNDMPNWPQNLLNSSAYDSGGFRVYNLQASACK
jgi:hypothetical protein